MNDDLVGWYVQKADWHFCSQLYHKWKIVLDYGEYATIVKTIQRGFGARFPGATPGFTIYYIPFRKMHLPIVGRQRGTHLITVLGAGEFKRIRQGLRKSQTTSQDHARSVEQA